MKLARMGSFILGCIGLIFGALGAVLPLIPTVPFLILAAWGFARSSKRFDSWFRTTRLYREHLEGYVSGEGISRQAKIRIMVIVTVVMAIAFILMDAAIVGRIVLLIVWVLHLIYFAFVLKTREWQ